uniref:phosphoprotein ECPP44-like n=1 Tax=Erigeron canadensis TaxID=72917 RepID=UPI001CB93112|nr:phosphoprotein ECPP44-like [Erigeron canadensis]
MSTDEVVYHHAPKVDEVNETTTTTVEQSDRGLFDFMKSKKEEENKCEDAAISSEFDQKVQLSEPEPKAEEAKHETLFQKMHESHSGSSSSSSSDEECEDGEKNKKKKEKKSLTAQIKEKIEHKEKKEEEKVEKHEDDTCVPVEKYDEVEAPPHVSEVAHPIPTPEPEEKKGFMEKLKEKLPGGHKKVEEEHVAPPHPPTPVVEAHDEDKEKKGIFEKIKEKIPGYHSKSEEEKEKEKVKECD